MEAVIKTITDEQLSAMNKQLAELSKQNELQVKSLFDKFRLTFPSGDRRTKTSDDDIYQKVIEGVSFKIGTK
jgi:hypothetical protein